MENMTLGIFTDIDKADKAISDLKSYGFKKEDISIVARDTIRSKITEVPAEDPASSAGEGLVTGAAVGALAGVIVGIASLTVPALGGIIIAGPLAASLGLTGAAATAVAGAGTGALAGGLIGALVGLGLSEDEAKIYEEYIKNDGILVSVRTNDQNQSDVENIFVDNDADEIRTKIGSSR